FFNLVSPPILTTVSKHGKHGRRSLFKRYDWSLTRRGLGKLAPTGAATLGVRIFGASEASAMVFRQMSLVHHWEYSLCG
ncbi:MAG TPA: hypothetical protein VIN93_14450, partial [Bryobacteraceae bacterium]